MEGPVGEHGSAARRALAAQPGERVSTSGAVPVSRRWRSAGRWATDGWVGGGRPVERHGRGHGPTPGRRRRLRARRSPPTPRPTTSSPPPVTAGRSTPPIPGSASCSSAIPRPRSPTSPAASGPAAGSPRRCGRTCRPTTGWRSRPHGARAARGGGRCRCPSPARPGPFSLADPDVTTRPARRPPGSSMSGSTPVDSPVRRPRRCPAVGSSRCCAPVRSATRTRPPTRASARLQSTPSRPRSEPYRTGDGYQIPAGSWTSPPASAP